MPKELTKKQMAAIIGNREHMERVRDLINTFVIMMLKRGEEHDQTKIISPEMEQFAEAADLKDLTFGSEEYDQSKAALDDALQHHYATYRHHPQHFKNGIDDMNLVDLIEMFLDWKASSERQNDGNLHHSIEEGGKKFNMSEQLIHIFENTVELFE